MAGDADIWVCGQCRSVNNLRAKQCYNCRTPQHLAAVDPTKIEGTGHGQLRDIALPEFSASRGEAMLASVLILLVAGLNVVSTVVTATVVPTLIDDSATSADLMNLTSATSISIATIGVAILALTAWAYWLSRVVSAMPALGLGYPAANSLMAFVENFIPGLNLLRVPAIVRDVVRRLEPGETQARGEALIFAAWIGLFGGFLVPRVGVWLNWETSLEGSVRNALLIQGVATGLVLVGAIFLVALIWWIETRIAARRMQQLEGTEPPAPTAAGPASEPAPAEPRPSTPVGTPTPFAPTGAPFAPPRQTTPTPDPIGPAAPFAPTPSGVASPSAAPTVAGPLGALAASTAAEAFHRPITAATGPTAAAGPPEAPVARPAEEQADVERFADTRPAWNAPPAPIETPARPGPPLSEVDAPSAEDAPVHRAEPAPVPTGPRLHLQIDSGTSIVATLDGESETMTLAEVRAAAAALAKADGSVLIATTGTTFEARALAEQVLQAFVDARVPATRAD